MALIFLTWPNVINESTNKLITSMSIATSNATKLMTKDSTVLTKDFTELTKDFTVLTPLQIIFAIFPRNMLNVLFVI